VNYAIKPKFVDEFLVCAEIFIFRIKKDSTEFELIPIRFGKQILPNQENAKNSIIEWQENTDLERDKTRKYTL
jgi:hypothetical protein